MSHHIRYDFVLNVSMCSMSPYALEIQLFYLVTSENNYLPWIEVSICIRRFWI